MYLGASFGEIITNVEKQTVITELMFFVYLAPAESKYEPIISRRCVKILYVKYSGVLGDPMTGLVLGLRPANERRRYFVTTSLIGWEQT